MYADYSYYTTEYLCGRGATVPDTEWDFWEKQARQTVDLVTFDRIPKLDAIPVPVSECICELAELFYNADRISRQGLSDGVAGVLVNYSNDGQSGTFDLTGSAYTPEGCRTRAAQIIRKHLLNTGLMYTGVMEGE